MSHINNLLPISYGKCTICSNRTDFTKACCFSQAQEVAIVQ